MELTLEKIRKYFAKILALDITFSDIQQYLVNVANQAKHLQFTSKMQLAFLEDLYLLINDGIPANHAIEMMAQVTKGITQKVALSISQKIAEGQPLADGMLDWFSVNVVEIIRVGEAGGALNQTLKSAINMLSQRGIAAGAFVGAVSYPLFVIGIACIVIIYLNNSVFTQFRMIKPMSQWPDAGIRLVEIAIFIENWWWIVFLIILFTFFIFKRLLANYTGELRSSLDKIPPFSFYRQLTAARTLETLGLLVANGVVFKSAIKVMQYQANPYLNSHLVMMEHRLSMGKTNIADVLDTGLVNENDLMRLRIMAEVKGFEHGLIRMGIRGTDQATLTLKFISRIIGGMFLAIGGLLIIIIIQGIYLTGMALGV
jgi:type II secretory pathway component PulF